MVCRSDIGKFNIYDHIPGGVIIYHVGEDMKIFYANQSAWKFFECESQQQFLEFADYNFSNLICQEDRESLLEMMRTAKSNRLQEEHHIHYRMQTRSGRVSMVDDYGKREILPEFGEVVVTFFVETKNDSMMVNEVNDKLTHMLSMGQFLTFGDELIRRAEVRGEHTRYQFVFFNIRNFKIYNLKYGIANGNDVLQHVASMIRRYSGTDLVSRFTGDHFVALSESEELLERVENIQKEFHENYNTYGLELKAGIHRIRDLGEEAAAASDLAKAACDSIRDTSQAIRVYDEVLKKEIVLGNHIVQTIDRAVREHHIQVYYQPVIRTDSGKICGMEALARWIDPEYGFLTPYEFIPVLERERKITKLDLYMVRQICLELKEAAAEGLVTVPVSLNLSRIDFRECDIFHEVEAIVEAYGIARSMLNIEVTESMLMDDPELVRSAIEKFRNAGYEIWMDDFGSGYSSLNVLKDYTFDEIKLDMVFISNFSEQSKKIVKSVIAMAKEINVHTLAEGVETEEQLRFLKQIGCEKVQGYLFGRPMPRNELIQYCREVGLSAEPHNRRE